MISFDLQSTPLEKGITLLEASAGTGKTYTIEGLYLRLLLEEQLEVKDILVVTYTVAATAELRDRIRARINSAIDQYDRNELIDPALNTSRTPAASEAPKLLLRASISFDEAQVFTIHGFCQRVLKETAFETLITFDRQLEADSRRIQKTLLNDFRRVHFREQFPLCTQVAAASSFFEDKLRQLDIELSADAECQLLPSPPLSSLSTIEAELGNLADQIVTMWPQERDSALQFISNQQFSQDKKDGYTPQLIEAAVTALDIYCTNRFLTVAALKALRKLCRHTLVLSAKKKWKTADADINHPLFSLCGAFCEQADRLEILAFHAFRDFRQAHLQSLKLQQNIFTFDDLLSELGRILSSEAAPNLTQFIHSRYRAALIDEFQDTDKLQWKIFESFFGGPEQSLFIIGDPKQAIYRFRGADVHAYLNAASKAQRQLSLRTNWRSDPLLIQGVSALFKESQHPFRLDGIRFEEPDAASNPPSSKRFVIDPSLPQAPLRFSINPSVKKLNNPECSDWALGLMVDDIIDLLGSNTTIGGRMVRPSDIAVLARTNRENVEIQEALLSADVPAVLETDASVFDSDEARSLLQLMTAIVETRKAGYLKTALAGIFFGYNSTQLFDLDKDDTQWQLLAERFFNYGQVWMKRGFMVAYRILEKEEGIRERILSLPRGERMLTNILHLVEILHVEECSSGLSPISLLNWLKEHCEDSNTRGSFEHQLRLESDSNAVRVMSMHKSKGLEFPVVFLPCNFSPIKLKSNSTVFSLNGLKEPRVWIDNGLEAEEAKQLQRAAALEEEREDSIRLLYVALTRARNRCHMYLAPGCSDTQAGDFPISMVLGAEDWSSLTKRLEELSQRLPLSIAVDKREGVSRRKLEGSNLEEIGILMARTWPSGIDRRAMLTSFSAMRGNNVELPERDDDATAATVDETPLDGIHAFPKGASTGNFFHSIFEDIAFDESEHWEHTIRDSLTAYALDPALYPVAQKAISDVLNVELPELGLSLSRIPRKQLAKEVEFYFPVNSLNLAGFIDAFESAGSMWASLARYLKNTRKSDVQGYMKGYIDLLFQDDDRYHILDWKSNWLGPTPLNYTDEAILRVIGTERYFLQYSLYTVAMHRYLSARITNYSYETCMGNIYYVFLRGINIKKPGAGVHCVRLPETLVEALDATLSDICLA